jgi:OmpA-OmpF porin, OOP family
MKKIFASFIVLLALQTQAQFTYDYLRAADVYFKKGDYYSAAQYYEKYLGNPKGKDRQNGYTPYTAQTASKKGSAVMSSKEEAVYNLAESYRLLNYHVKAEPVYQQTLQFSKNKFPLTLFHYATTLRALAKYEEAEKAFGEFLAGYANKDLYSEAAEREVQNLRYVQTQLNKKDINLYTLNKAEQGLNSKGASYAPVWVNTNTILFTSTRPDDTSVKNATYTNRLYTASYSNGTATGISKAGLPETPGFHQGVNTITPDGNTMFLTRWELKGTVKTAALYVSNKSGGGWTVPAALDETVNTPGYNTQQPFVLPGGKQILFASNRPGGEGGTDLWMADLLLNGAVANITNLGNTINTKYDEQAPYYHQPTGALVFSTNGRVGMGGYDFFYAKGTPGNWKTPVNFGYPVNSIKDDIYFTSRGDATNILGDVLLSSDRSAECCLELFTLKKAKLPKNIKGSVVACDDKKPINGAKVEITDASGNVVHTAVTGPDGSYSLVLGDYKPLKVTGSSAGFATNSLNFNSPTDEEELTLNNPDLCLTPTWPPAVGEEVVLEEIYFDFDSASLREESSVLLEKVYNMMVKYPAVAIEIGAHTDSKGSDSYNQKLSEARAESVVNYLVEKGIDRSRMQAVGYGEAKPIAPNQNDNGSDNPEGRQKNRRTEFKVLEK